jgi:hypothetical protein
MKIRPDDGRNEDGVVKKADENVAAGERNPPVYRMEASR